MSVREVECFFYTEFCVRALARVCICRRGYERKRGEAQKEAFVELGREASASMDGEKIGVLKDTWALRGGAFVCSGGRQGRENLR